MQCTYKHKVQAHSYTIVAVEKQKYYVLCVCVYP